MTGLASFREHTSPVEADEYETHDGQTDGRTNIMTNGVDL